MPIEINQLNIKVNVEGEEKPEQLPNAGSGKKDKESIIAACVEAILDILERKENR
jgi:hypothetical protein